MCPQESTVTTFAHKASGDPTVHSAAPARTADPALQRTAHVCVHLDTGERPAKEVSVLCGAFSPKSLRCSKIMLQEWEGRSAKLHSPDLDLIFEELLTGDHAGETALGQRQPLESSPFITAAI